MLVRAAVALVTGDLAARVARSCGVRSIQEEADDEAATGERVAKERAHDRHRR